MSEWATLDTRPPKGHGETVGEALARWEARERGFGTQGLARQWDAALDQRYRVGDAQMSLSDIVVATERHLVGEGPGVGPVDRELLVDEVRRTLHGAGLSGREAGEVAAAGVERAVNGGALGLFDRQVLADAAVRRVSEKKATWTRSDLARQVERLDRRQPALGAGELQDRVDRLVELALRPGGAAVPLTAPAVAATPPELRRASDGRNEHERHTAVRYASIDALRAEGRLVNAARTGGGPVVPAAVIDEHIRRGGLGLDQAAAARHVLGSGRRLDVVVGPAGTGKTHTTAAIAEAWKADRAGAVLGLALSQNAAQVLAEASGNRAENIAKWLFENGRGTPGWQVTPGQLVIVDEAGMVPTGQLDQVAGRVIAGGGKVLLIGDPEQLAAPGAGGGMRLIVADVGATHLDEVRRFDSPWEANASLGLRGGDPDALIEYDRRARIVGGTAEVMQDAAYTAWLADTLGGRTSLLMADTNEHAAQLASRARVDLVRAGRVEDDGVRLADANRAGVGDQIVTRRNDRKIAENGTIVANRDEWTVEAVGADGSLTVRRHDQAAGVGRLQDLPAGYVAEHVQLAYASTVHGAQGRTVDTSHAVMSQRTGRDGLYVAMTRGREGNWAYVACEQHDRPDEAPVTGDPVAVLVGVMTTDEPALAATQVLRDEHHRAESLHTLYPQWKDALDQHTENRWADATARAVGPELAVRMRDEPAWPTLVARLQSIEDAGLDAEAAIAQAAAGRELTSAVDAAAVVQWRLDTTVPDQLADHPTEPADDAPTEAGERRSFVEATPAHARAPQEEQLLVYARQLAERMDQRAETLAATLVETGAARAMTIGGPADYWAVNNHDPDSQPTGRPEIHAAWTAARDSLATDMADWAAFVDARADRVHRGEGWPTMTERVDEVIGGELAHLQPGSAYAATFVDDATPHERTFTLQPIAAIPTLEAGDDQNLPQPGHWVDRLGPVPEDPATRLEWAERAGTVAAYQEIIGGSDDDPLGARPAPGQPDIRARWEAANEALNGPPVAAAQVSDEDLQARVDRAAQLVAEAPEVVLDRLREAHQDARDQQTRAGLVALDPAAEGAVEESAVGAVVSVFGVDPGRYEEAQQQREDWVADYGAEVAAGPSAAAELARREAAQAARPFVDLDDDRLHRATRIGQDEVVALDRRASERVGVVELYRRQATALEDEARTVEWTHPTWAKVNQDRQAETDAAGRLTAIDERLDRSALRGGPRVEQRAQLQVEALQLRSAHPGLGSGADRAPVWEERAEHAWVEDTATVERLRGDATALRGKAERVAAALGPLAEQRGVAQVRLDQLMDEGRQRQTEPPRPETGRSAGPGLERPGAVLQPAAGDPALPEHAPGVDPAQPLPPAPGLDPRPGGPKR